MSERLKVKTKKPGIRHGYRVKCFHLIPSNPRELSRGQRGHLN